MNAQLSIGQLATQAGVNVETIRYYQRRSLLMEPAKPISGHRVYSADLVRRIRFIKRAQGLGFSLDEVSALLGLDDGQACARTRELAACKLQDIERKLMNLAAMKATLSSLVRQCEAPIGAPSCPIIKALAAD